MPVGSLVAMEELMFLLPTDFPTFHFQAFPYVLNFIFLFFLKLHLLYREYWCVRVWQDVWICSSPDRTTLNVFALLICFCLLLQCLQRSSVCCVCTKSKPCELYYPYDIHCTIIVSAHDLFTFLESTQCVKIPSGANEPHVLCTRNVTPLFCQIYCMYQDDSRGRFAV